MNNLRSPHVTAELVRRMEALSFFDEEVTRDLLFITVHDAVLFIQLETSSENADDHLVENFLVIFGSCFVPEEFKLWSKETRKKTFFLNQNPAVFQYISEIHFTKCTNFFTA